MNRTVIIQSAVPLTKAEEAGLAAALKLTAADSVSFNVDPEAIAGLRVSVDGQTVDLTVKRQLQELVK